jgi:hypothetical protein
MPVASYAKKSEIWAVLKPVVYNRIEKQLIKYTYLRKQPELRFLKKIKKTIDISTDNSYSLIVIGERGCGNCWIIQEL